MTTTGTPARIGFVNGATAVGPLLLGVVPFGLIVGVAAANSVIGVVPAWSTGLIIFAGAAQLVVIDLFNSGAAAGVIIATAVVINLRHMMYSAALADAFRAFPTPWRFGLPYVLTDQAFAISVTHFEHHAEPVYRRWFFLGAGTGLWLPWQIAMTTGAVLGAQVPASWSLDFAVPLVFIVLVILAVKNTPTVVAALVGGVAAVVGMDIPYNLGLIVAAALGIAAGVVVERLTR